MAPSVPTTPLADVTDEPGSDKGLKGGALGLMSSVVIGVASTAPAYSLAATIGAVVLAVGLQSPAVMILAFLPMLCIAVAYQQLNRVDPDCGTTFTWATRAFGPHTGWMGGWAIVAADIIVMANLAQIAGQYGFLLVGPGHPRRQHLRDDGGRCHLDRPDDVDLLRRHRALGTRAVRPARGWRWSCWSSSVVALVRVWTGHAARRRSRRRGRGSTRSRCPR